MPNIRLGQRWWVPAIWFALAGGCGLNASGLANDVGADPGPEGFDGEVPPPDDAGGDRADDAGGDRADDTGGDRADDTAEATICTGPAECNDGIACTVDTCSPETGSCAHEPNDAACDDGVSCTVDSCRPTGGCAHLPPDADSDTYPDAECYGNDCDDAQAEVHPGAPELCNGRDDNCDGTTDDAATCEPLPHAVTQCVGGTCEITGCDPDWGDCNEMASDGCEQSLTSLSHCGDCHATCAPRHATDPNCTTGTCDYASCEPGWLDCNGDTEDGCEVSAGGSDAACRISCDRVVDCSALPAVSAATCGSTGCTINECTDGYAECDDNVDNGCEQLLDTPEGTCSAATNLGEVSGDSTSDSLVATHSGAGWYSFRVREDVRRGIPLTATIQLDVPDGVDYDIYVLCGASGCDSDPGPSGSGSAGRDETVNIRWNDQYGDTSRTVYFRIDFWGGSTLDCGDWTVTITGNTSVSESTC